MLIFLLVLILIGLLLHIIILSLLVILRSRSSIIVPSYIIESLAVLVGLKCAQLIPSAVGEQAVAG